MVSGRIEHWTPTCDGENPRPAPDVARPAGRRRVLDRDRPFLTVGIDLDGEAQERARPAVHECPVRGVIARALDDLSPQGRRALARSHASLRLRIVKLTWWIPGPRWARKRWRNP